jgi:hypothetical protein
MGYEVTKAALISIAGIETQPFARLWLRNSHSPVTEGY